MKIDNTTLHDFCEIHKDAVKLYSRCSIFERLIAIGDLLPNASPQLIQACDGDTNLYIYKNIITNSKNKKCFSSTSRNSYVGHYWAVNRFVDPLFAPGHPVTFFKTSDIFVLHIECRTPDTRKFLYYKDYIYNISTNKVEHKYYRISQPVKNWMKERNIKNVDDFSEEDKLIMLMEFDI